MITSFIIHYKYGSTLQKTGSGESIENTDRFYTFTQGVRSEFLEMMAHGPFPGCDQHTGFRTDLKMILPLPKSSLSTT